MDYKKLYEQAFSRAQELIINENGIVRVDRPLLEQIFPELAEFEDERIMKAIKYCIKQGFIGYGKIENVTPDKCLAWLEKQGEKPILSNSLTSEQRVEEAMRYIEEKSKAYMEAHKGETADEFIARCRGEQKPADKVELHFHVEKGKWYMCIKNNVGITKGNAYYGISDGYIIDDNGRKYNCKNWAVFQGYLRLWDITIDARDGDVLSDGATIFIFKDLLSDGSVMSYCDYDTDSGESDAFCPLSVNLMCSKITPATKEEREQLEKAIADAGYTFDFEKKELKKIEQKPSWSEDETSIAIKDSKAYRIGFADGEAYAKEEMQSTWSEEDEKMVETALQLAHECGRHGLWYWLNSLKDRLK